MSSGWLNDYAGDVSAEEAYEILGREPKAQLVDVRTRAEWSYVGIPDLSGLGKETILAEWQRYPTMDVATDFVDHLERELERRSVGREDPVLFLCRSGARSLSAAQAMLAAGWKGARNVSAGFEGPANAERHRGTLEGWKASTLPWIQS
jgi:rhodanese-related sulfurtransferase